MAGSANVAAMGFHGVVCVVKLLSRHLIVSGLASAGRRPNPVESHTHLCSSALMYA